MSQNQNPIRPRDTFNEIHCRFCGQILGDKNLYDGSTEKYCGVCDYVFFSSITPTRCDSSNPTKSFSEELF
jgi:hypothetical protein